MKLKRYFCVILTLVFLVSCMGVSVSAREQFSVEEVENSSFVLSRATGKFDIEVSANSAVKAGSSFSLEVGEVVTIKASYTPFSASVDFGVIAPDGLFYGLNTTTGSFDKAIEVNQRGQYYLAVRNNSSQTISVSGYVNY